MRYFEDRSSKVGLWQDFSGPLHGPPLPIGKVRFADHLRRPVAKRGRLPWIGAAELSSHHELHELSLLESLDVASSELRMEHLPTEDEYKK
jgi:hypothetical protein